MQRVKLFLLSLVTMVTLSVGFSSCGGVTTESLRQTIKKDITTTVAKTHGIKVVDFQLVHLEGNYYSGTLTTMEDGQKFVYNVDVTYDGSNYKWEILE